MGRFDAFGVSSSMLTEAPGEPNKPGSNSTSTRALSSPRSSSSVADWLSAFNEDALSVSASSSASLLPRARVFRFDMGTVSPPSESARDRYDEASRLFAMPVPRLALAVVGRGGSALPLPPVPSFPVAVVSAVVSPLVPDTTSSNRPKSSSDEAKSRAWRRAQAPGESPSVTFTPPLVDRGGCRLVPPLLPPGDNLLDVRCPTYPGLSGGLVSESIPFPQVGVMSALAVAFISFRACERSVGEKIDRLPLPPRPDSGVCVIYLTSISTL